MRKYNTVLIKPASSLCNMKCRYCFYNDEANNRSKKYGCFMSKDTVINIIKKFIDDTEKALSFVFQGGEPLLIGLNYYQEFVDIVNKYNTKNITINYSIQTNGLLIDRSYADFFKVNNFLVGISLDGIKDIHDKYRTLTNNNGTYDKVIDSIKLLDVSKVNYNILTVISKDIAKRISSVYKTYKNLNLKYVQFIPLIDNLRTKKGSKEYSLNNESYLNYLIKMFDYWYSDILNDKRWYHRYFDSLLNRIGTNCNPECTMDNKCGIMYSIEANGDTYPCDFYMLDEYYLGNINLDDINTIDSNRIKINFIKDETTIKCKKCKYYFLCMGGCKRDKVNNQNYYCEAYYKFFEYAYPKYLHLIDLIKKGII